MPSSVYVRYTGRADYRTFTEADFTGKGIEDQGDVEFNHDNRWVNSVSPEAAGYLIGTGEFVKANEEDAEPVEEEPVQKVAFPGEAIPGENKGVRAPVVTQDEPDSQKSSSPAEDYSAFTKAELLDEIERRNGERDEEDQLPHSGNKDDLVAVLEQDDQEQ